jgi:hypothetical protein
MLVDWFRNLRRSDCSAFSEVKVAFRSVYWTLTSLELEDSLTKTPIARIWFRAVWKSAEGTLMTTLAESLKVFW